MLAVSTICAGYRGNELFVSGTNRLWSTFSTIRYKSAPELPQYASKKRIYCHMMVHRRIWSRKETPDGTFIARMKRYRHTCITGF